MTTFKFRETKRIELALTRLEKLDDPHAVALVNCLKGLQAKTITSFEIGGLNLPVAVFHAVHGMVEERPVKRGDPDEYD